MMERCGSRNEELSPISLGVCLSAAQLLFLSLLSSVDDGEGRKEKLSPLSLGVRVSQTRLFCVSSFLAVDDGDAEVETGS